MFWNIWTKDIREKTKGMDKKSKVSYVFLYYWPHMLITGSIIALIFIFGRHYLFGNKKPEFTCILVNQRCDPQRDLEMAESYAQLADLDSDRVIIDSDYNFSYEGLSLKDVNESSCEKFFFLWRNGEIDAVVLSETMYQYCCELGGEFYCIEDTLGFPSYTDGAAWENPTDEEDYIAGENPADEETHADGVDPTAGEECTAVVLGYDSFTEEITGNSEEPLLLAFPKTGKHSGQIPVFLEYMKENWSEMQR
ncbi:MAG: hypothetical protein Q4B85_10165 [Lachnospiraceae bacterium]|nr:hypothetical protein [Lachnospiraceae bacterium]